MAAVFPGARRPVENTYWPIRAFLDDRHSESRERNLVSTIPPYRHREVLKPVLLCLARRAYGKLASSAGERSSARGSTFEGGSLTLPRN